MKDQKNELIAKDSWKTEENETKLNPTSKQLLTPLDFLEYSSVFLSMINNNAKDYLERPIEVRVDILKKRIHHLDMIEAILKNNIKAVLKKQLKFEEKRIKEDHNNGSGIYHLLTPEEILQNMSFNKTPIHSKMIDFGHRIGFIVYHLKNSNGHHYFDFETVILVRWVCALFVQSNGEPLNEKTMLEYIADGRKMKFSDFENGLF